MKYSLFPPQSLEPQGWLKRQLEIQMEGLSGNLHKMWPDIRDSIRIGGTRHDWERVPYWLDGFIPLSFLLDDEEKKLVVEQYVEGILNGQQKDGWIGTAPKEQQEFNDNTWEYLLTCKVLALYCDFVHSEIAEKALQRALYCLYESMQKGEVRLISWGKYRWFEGLISILHVYRRTKENWLVELAKMLREQGVDWTSIKDKWMYPMNEWTLDTHIVNIAMMFKYEALCCEMFGETYTNQAEELWKYLSDYHGTVAGAFSGDECLAGTAANRGFELCSVVELMYSCEILFSVTGKKIWAERLEQLAFNALPATLSDDMWSHQYVQMTNQIACYNHPGKPFYGTNTADANIFGLEPQFGCCTSNFNQGWPKLVMNVFQKYDKGILVALLLPCCLTTTVKDSQVSVTTETLYPFNHKVKFIVEVDKPIAFSFKIRIPSWAKGICLNGKQIKGNADVVIRKEFSGKEEIVLELLTEPRMLKRSHKLHAVQYGALLYSLPIQMRKQMHEYEKDGVERQYPYCDYEYFPESAWNYGFASRKFEIIEEGMSEIPFSSKQPPVMLRTRMAKVAWPMAEGYSLICDRMPLSNRAISDEETINLIPYGCAKLRMTEMPIVR